MVVQPVEESADFFGVPRGVSLPGQGGGEVSLAGADVVIDDRSTGEARLKRHHAEMESGDQELDQSMLHGEQLAATMAALPEPDDPGVGEELRQGFQIGVVATRRCVPQGAGQLLPPSIQRRHAHLITLAAAIGYVNDPERSATLPAKAGPARPATGQADPSQRAAHEVPTPSCSSGVHPSGNRRTSVIRDQMFAEIDPRP